MYLVKLLKSSLKIWEIHNDINLHYTLVVTIPHVQTNIFTKASALWKIGVDTCVLPLEHR